MELFVKLCRLCPSSFRELTKLVSDIIDKFVSVIEYLFPDFEVQDVVDNMLTRLEELTSVLQMVKLKNHDCSSAVAEDISTYRSEITALSKRITTLLTVIQKLHSNVDLIEKQVNKAELDFGVNTDNRIKSFLKPFLKRNKEAALPTNQILSYEKYQFESVLDNFEDSKQCSC